MTSCVLVGPILIPGGRDVNDEAGKECKDEIDDRDDDPLANVQLRGWFQLLGLVRFD